MKKTIVLCADDYGQAPAISQGILALIKSKRLSAVSCLVNSRYWHEHSTWLHPYQGQVDIGLHLNLTEGQALYQRAQQTTGESFPALPVLLFKAFFRQISQKTIENEFHAQLDEFEKAMGTLPNFIDGHQHIHQFPVIRAAIINIYKQRLPGQTYIRLVNEKSNLMDWLQNRKKIIIRLTGAKAFKKLLEKHRIPHNTSFAGIYSFDNASSYSEKFLHFLQKIDDRGLIMCHPGLSSPGVADSIADARYKEYQYFASHHFIQDCEKHQVLLKRQD